MRKRKSGRKFGRRSGVRRAFLRSLVASLILHGRIRTTQARAKEVRMYAERAVTLAKRENKIAARRNLQKLLPVGAAHILMKDLAPRFLGRSGGYTRIRTLGTVRKDGAPEVLIEFLKD